MWKNYRLRIGDGIYEPIKLPFPHGYGVHIGFGGMEVGAYWKVWGKGYIGGIGRYRGQYYYRADGQITNTLIRGLLLDPIPMVAIFEVFAAGVRIYASNS